MSFHDLVRTLRDLDEIRATSTALASRLEAAQRHLAGLGVAAEHDSLEQAYAGLRALDDAAARLSGGAGSAEFRLRATVHVPSLAAWPHVRALAGAFAAHPDWEGEVTLPRELVDEIPDCTLPVVALEDWLTEGRLTDVSLTLQRYRGATAAQLAQASWATVLLAVYELPEEIEDYWQVLGDEPLPYPVPTPTSQFAARLAALPQGTIRLLWCPASYDDFFADGPDSTGVIELARRHDDVVLLWARDDVAVQGLRAREQAYLADLAAALTAEGTAIEVGPRDLSYAFEQAHGVCGGSAEVARVGQVLGHPVLDAPTDAGVERLRGLVAAGAARRAPEPVEAALADQLRDAFVRDFLGSE